MSRLLGFQLGCYKAGVPAEADAQPVRRASFKIARNAASIFLGDAAGEVLVGYALILAAVSLGPAGFGTLSEAQAFMEPFDALAALGLVSVSITVAARRGGVDGELRGTVFGIRFASAAVAIVLGLLVAVLTGRGHLWPLLLTFGVGMLFTPFTLASLLPFQYDQAIHKRIAVPFFVGVVRLSTSYLAFWFLNRPIGYQLAVLAASVAGAGMNWWWARRHFPGSLRFDGALARQLLAIGWPAAVLEFVVSLYMRASYFLLHKSGPAVQGEYAAADRLTRPLLALGGAVFVSSLPTIAQLATQKHFERLAVVYRRSVLRITLGLIPIAAVAWALSSWILVKFAPEYAGAIWPFRILTLGTFFMFLNQLSTTFIVALGKFRVIMTVAIVNLLVYLVLAPQLIPIYGAAGAATATTVMEGINTAMQLGVVFYLLKDAQRAHA